MRGIPTTRYVMPHHRRNCTAAASKRYAHVVEGKLVSTGQIAKRIGIHEETALRRAKRGPFPLTWEGLAKRVWRRGVIECATQSDIAAAIQATSAEVGS